VEVEVDVDATAPVRESTRAIVDRNLITGIATIQLITLQEDSPPLRDAPEGDGAAVIPEGESQQFAQTMNQLAQRADDTLGRISSTLSAENQAAIGETLENIRIASRNVNALTARLDTTLVSIGRAADSMRSSTQLATGDFHRLAYRYDTLGAEAGTSLRAATGVVQQVGADVSRLASRAEDLAGDADTELRLTGQQLRSAADAVGATAKKLNDPRAALFGPSSANLGPGETRP
jgi:phospholipid/cholesterol/gamma-HCH transport system substrate-binding protein